MCLVNKTVKSVSFRIEAYLGESAFVQKTGAKPRTSCSGERKCQGGPAMDRREVACSRCRAGSRLGLARGRTSEFCVKPDGLAPNADRPLATEAVSRRGVGMVLRALTPGQWHVHLTGEVPPCPGLLGPVTGGYKARPKGRRDARMTGTRSHWPRLWGYQQSQSRSRAVMSAAERQNHREFVGPVGFRRKVSRRIEATQWPAGTAFRSVFRSLRNALIRPGVERRTIQFP